VPEDSLQTAARLARRMPGYRWVRRRAVPRIRQSATARALAHRMFPSQPNGSGPNGSGPNGSGPPVDVAPGKLLAGVGVEQLPVVLLSLVGLAEGTAENPAVGKLIDAVIDEVAGLQLLGAGFRPVFLLDTPAFSQARCYGYPVELVTPAPAWSGDPADWPGYIGARVASMMRTYGISAVVTVGPHGLDEVGRGMLLSFG
jgi:hypothetical protein